MSKSDDTTLSTLLTEDRDRLRRVAATNTPAAPIAQGLLDLDREDWVDDGGETQ